MFVESEARGADFLFREILYVNCALSRGALHDHCFKNFSAPAIGLGKENEAVI